MSTTTYDEIIKSFVNNCGVDTSRLPDDEEKLYDIIQNAISHYNAHLKDESPIVGNNDLECLNIFLDGTRLLILAYCTKYIHLENHLVEFQELWFPFQHDLGIKNYKSQVDGREKTLERTEKKIIELKSTLEDPSIM